MDCRALTALVSLATALATASSVGCSSNGSSFDTGMGGSGSPGPTGNTAGSDNPNPTGATGGDGAGMAGSGQVNPTQAMGGMNTGGVATGGQATGGDAPQGGVATGGGGGAGGTPPAPCWKAPEICHEFLANDNSRNVVNYVNEFDETLKDKAGVVWSKSVGVTGVNSPRTIEIVDNTKAVGGKAVLVSVDNGYVELGMKDGAKVAQVTVNFTGITGACRMPDGNTALGTNSQIRIVGPTGNQVRAFNLPAGPELRAINRNPETGNFWFSKTESVYEVTDQGQAVWDANMGAGTKGYAVWWRPGGGAYATTGDPSTVVEISSAGQILATVGGKKTFTFLDFFSGFVRLANGNYVVANWLGHLAQPAADAPHVVEFSPDNKVVWKWGNQTLARQITNVFVLR